MSPSSRKHNRDLAARRIRQILAAVVLSTVLVSGLGIWVLLQPRMAPAGQSAMGSQMAPEVQTYLGPSQLDASQPIAFPAYVTSPELNEAYRFAVDRPDVLMYLPCYCGCGLEAGHRSNLDCFVAGVDRRKTVVFDDHGSGCETCVGIAIDAKRLLGQGKSLKEIRATVDRDHGAKGPGTNTPLPPG